MRGEKESLSTLSTHLQQQLDEQTTEHRIHLQRLKNEADALLKDKSQLVEQLVIQIFPITIIQSYLNDQFLPIEWGKGWPRKGQRRLAGETHET